MIITQKTIISFDLRKEYQQAMQWIEQHPDWIVDDTSSVGIICWNETTTMIDMYEQSNN